MKGSYCSASNPDTRSIDSKNLYLSESGSLSKGPVLLIISTKSPDFFSIIQANLLISPYPYKYEYPLKASKFG